MNRFCTAEEAERITRDGLYNNRDEIAKVFGAVDLVNVLIKCSNTDDPWTIHHKDNKALLDQAYWQFAHGRPSVQGWDVTTYIERIWLNLGLIEGYHWRNTKLEEGLTRQLDYLSYTGESPGIVLPTAASRPYWTIHRLAHKNEIKPSFILQRFEGKFMFLAADTNSGVTALATGENGQVRSRMTFHDTLNYIRWWNKLAAAHEGKAPEMGGRAEWHCWEITPEALLHTAIQDDTLSVAKNELRGTYLYVTPYDPAYVDDVGVSADPSKKRGTA